MMREKKANSLMERKAAAPSPAASKGHRSNIRRPARPDPPRSPTPPPLETRRSLRPRTATLYVAADYDSPSSEEERERERERRKVKLVKLHRSPAARKPAPDPSSDSDSASSTSFSSYGEDDAVKPPKKRRINGGDDGGGSDGSGQLEQLRRQSVPKSKIGFLGKSLGVAKTAKATRLPDRNVLEEVLDKLQKKDTYGVYGQPVDLEELPDYYDVIEHPMDFGTVRKKLARSVYRTFEQFEDDVFLICSNAMQYNAPHTVYFRQARAIEEMARKNFQILRADAKSIETVRKSEEQIKFSPKEEKQLKKSTYKAEREPLGSDISSSGTRTSAGDTCTGSNVDRANDLKVRLPNVGEKPANSVTSITPRANVIKKAASSNGLDMLSDNAVEKPASANGVRMAHTSSVQKPATSNGSSAVQAKSAEKTSAANVSRLSMEDANAIETIASVKRLSTLQANIVEKPATANVSSTGQTDAGKEASNAHGLSLPRANSIEKRSTSTGSGLSMIAANAAEKPATSTGLGRAHADAGQEVRNSHGLSSPRANSTEKRAASTGLCTTAANPVERPVTSNGSGKAQTNAIEQTTIAKGFAESSSPADESRSEMVDEFSVKYSPSKVGRKPIVVDENRRLTYNHPEEEAAVGSDSVLHIFDSEMKQLVDVGFHSENSYALSLARFAAYLGPVGWEIASEKIQKVLPSDVKFGRGWVGEFEPLSTPVLSLKKGTQQPIGDRSTMQKSGPKMDKEVEVKSNTSKKGNYDAKQFGVHSQANIAMTRHPKEIISSELKHGIIGSTSAETQPAVSNPVLQQKISNPVLQQAETQPKISNPVLQQAETQPKICDPVRQQAETLPKITNPVLQQAETQPKICNPVRRQAETLPKISNPVRQQAETQPKISNPVRQQAETQPKISNLVRQQAETQPKISNPVREQAETLPKISNPVLQEAETQLKISNPVLRQQAEAQPKISNPVLQQQKGRVAGDSSACKEKSEQIGLCNSSSISSISVEKSLQRPSLHSEAHRQRSHGGSADVQSRVSNVVAQQRNREVDFTKISSNASEQAGVSNSSSINSIPAETPSQRREFYPQAQKQGMFSISSVPQSRISSTMLRQQKDRSDIDTSKTCIGASQRNLTSIGDIPAETVLQRDQYHRQGLFGVSVETQRRISDTMQHQKDQAAGNFMKAYQNAPQNLYSVGNIPAEKDVPKTMFPSETATNSWSQEFIGRSRNQLPPEQLKETLGLAVGGLGNHQATGGSSNNRAVTSMDFVTSRQSGVAGYSLPPSGSCEQAVDFRLMDLSGKMSNQPSYHNINFHNANQVRSSIPPPIRDDACTWTSFRGSAERVPGVVHPHMGSAPQLNSAWKTPASAVRVHGDSMMKTSHVLPHPVPFGNEEAQNQGRGLAFFPQMGGADLSRFHGRPPWQGLSPHSQPRQMDTHPPDLNIGFQPSGSPVRLSSGIVVDSQQPDLALQL